MPVKRFVLSLVTLATLALPAVATASVEFQIVNDTSPKEEVWVTVYATNAGGDEFDVTGWSNNEAKKLSEIPEGKITIEKLISGRVYVSYGSPIDALDLPFTSPEPRFDWAELTVTPSSSDTANLTAVDQFGIGMRMETLNGADEVQETLGDANSDAVFAALQGIPGGPESTIRDSSENPVRVLSPLHSSAYPLLGDYARSMAGQTIALHAGIYTSPFKVAEYSGTFAADGSIVLHGGTNPAWASAPATIDVPVGQLLPEIYAPQPKPSLAEEVVLSNFLAAFSIGLWGGRYGNDSLSFCTDREEKAEGWVCPNGFNQPAFGEARTSFPTFPTCEQYAAVINQFSDSYGAPYSDASKRVVVGLNPADVAKLRLTILPDSGSDGPVHSGNSNCGAAAPPPAPAVVPPAAPPAPSVKALKLFKKGWVKGRKARVGRVLCTGRCGGVKLIAKKGRKVIGRVRYSVKGPKGALTLRLTKPGKRMLAHRRRVKAKVAAWVSPPGGRTVHRARAMALVKRRGHKRHRRHR